MCNHTGIEGPDCVNIIGDKNDMWMQSKNIPRSQTGGFTLTLSKLRSNRHKAKHLEALTI